MPFHFIFHVGVTRPYLYALDDPLGSLCHFSYGLSDRNYVRPRRMSPLPFSKGQLDPNLRELIDFVSTANQVVAADCAIIVCGNSVPA